MPTTTMGKNSIAFLDTNNTVNEDGRIEVGVYRKTTHTSKYLDFHSHSPAQSKRAVVKTLMNRAKCIPSTTAQRQNEKQRVINDLKANGYPESFIKSAGESNKTNTQPRTQENPKAYTSIPYVKGVSERVRRILSRENIKTAFKPVRTLGNIFKKPKDRPNKERLKGIVYKVTCRTCSFAYVGESKRSWKSRGAAIKHHAEIGHDIHPSYAEILETGLTELQMLNNDFMSLQNSVVLAKCIRARLWENSKFVSRQLEKVGPSLSTMMVNAGLTTFKKIEETNPREIEMIREAASNLPKYELSVQQTGRQQPNRAEIVITLTMTNYMKRRDAIGSGRNSHFCLLLIADADNKMVFKQRLGDFVFVKEGYWSKRVDIQRAAVQSPELNIHLISQEYVGLDVSKTFTPHYSGVGPFLIMKREPQANIPKNVKKVASSSDICLYSMERDEGPNRLPLKGTSTKDAVRKNAEEKSNMNMFLKNLHQRTQAIPGTPAKRLKMSAPETGETNFVDLTLDERFGYTRKSPFHHDVDSYRVKSEDHVKKKHLGESCWEEIEWHKRQMEEQQDMGEDYTDDDHLADELPCFSVDELWNDDELASILNDDNDTFASPPNPYSWGRGNKVSQSHYYELTAPERCQKKSNVKSQTIKTQMSDEVKRPPSRSSQFLTGSTPKVTKGTSLYVSSSQPKGNPRRILYPLPPPPPTPGADDFEMTSQTWPARRAYSGNWDEELPNPDTTERITQRQKWSSLTLDPLRDMLEKENWGIFPEFTKPCHQRNTSSANQETHNPTNLESPLSATYLDPLAMQEGICLEEESASAIDSHFSTDRCKQSPISSSFFCSKSFKSSEKEHEEQDAFAGIFNGLL
ncbi:hypothetical protein ACROYT_G033018 [Oculina patagonica]